MLNLIQLTEMGQIIFLKLLGTHKTPFMVTLGEIPLVNIDPLWI